MIPREAAREEVSRVAKYLAGRNRSVILFGGLAVNQHVPTRDSVDLDLVCDDELLRDLIASLYPGRDWRVEEVNDDGYRPKYIIRSRNRQSYPVIEIGPKITERPPYPHIDWSALSEGSTPFHYQRETFDSVRVPSPSALFFSKIISFVNRSAENAAKLRKDFDDLRSLSETSGFSPGLVMDLIEKSGARKFIQERFQARCQRLNLSLESVSFLDLAQLLATASQSERPSATGIVVASRLGTTIQSEIYSGFSIPSSDVWQAGVTLIPGLLQSVDYASIVLDSYEVREYRSAAHARLSRGTQNKNYRCLAQWSALSTFIGTDRSVLDDAGNLIKPADALRACVVRCRDLISNGVQFRYIPADTKLTNAIADNFVVFDRAVVMLESLGVVIEVSDPKACASFVRRFEELWSCALSADQALARFSADVDAVCSRC